MSLSPLRIVVHGAAGRMGRRVVALALEDRQISSVAGVESASSSALGSDVAVLAGLPASGQLLQSQWPAWLGDNSSGRAVIDFSLPVALDGCLDACVAAGAPLVVATTGLEADQQARLRQAAESIAICWAPSMSLAVNLSMRLTQQMAAALNNVPGGVDVEIIERHHRYKEDAPSGTALKFGELIAQQLAGNDAGSGIDHVHGREGKVGRRSDHEIGYHAIRVGDNPGEHTIVFGMLGEKIELNVAASSRDCYATGAIAAAKWLQGRPAGLYDMFDVLGV